MRTSKIQNGHQGAQKWQRGAKQLLLNKFFDPSTPSMRKGRDGGTGKKNGKKRKIRMKIVATTSLPAVDRPNVNRWNAARSRQNQMLVLVEINSPEEADYLCKDPPNQLKES